MRTSGLCVLTILALSLTACATNNKPTNIAIGAVTGTLAAAPTGNPAIMVGGAAIGAIAGYAMPSTDKSEHEVH